MDHYTGSAQGSITATVTVKPFVFGTAPEELIKEAPSLYDLKYPAPPPPIIPIGPPCDIKCIKEREVIFWKAEAFALATGAARIDPIAAIALYAELKLANNPLDVIVIKVGELVVDTVRVIAEKGADIDTDIVLPLTIFSLISDAYALELEVAIAAGDPFDPDFKVVASPLFGTFQPFSVVGLDPNIDSALQDFTVKTDRLFAFTNVIVTTLNRYSSAVQVGDFASAVLQLNALGGYLQSEFDMRAEVASAVAALSVVALHRTEESILMSAPAIC